MNLTKFDITIIVVMSIAVISMSFVFPVLGLTAASTNESDVPEFDMQSDRFDFAGEVPDNPGTPSQGTLEVQNDSGEEVELHDNGTASITLSAVNDSSTDGLNPMVLINKFNDSSSSPFQRSTTLNDTGDVDTIEEFGYEVEILWQSTTNIGDADETATVSYEVLDQPSDETWLTRVPIVGGIVSGANALASIVGWIGSLIWWGATFVIQMGLNVIGMVVDVAVYFVSTLSWLVGTYADIVSGANSWAAVFVAVPGILLFAELAKVVMILISLLPTT